MKAGDLEYHCLVVTFNATANVSVVIPVIITEARFLEMLLARYSVLVALIYLEISEPNMERLLKNTGVNLKVF